MEGCICMSMNELKRLEIVIKVTKKRLSQTEASVKLLKRLVKQFRAHKEDTAYIKEKRSYRK